MTVDQKKDFGRRSSGTSGTAIPVQELPKLAEVLAALAHGDKAKAALIEADLANEKWVKGLKASLK